MALTPTDDDQQQAALLEALAADERRFRRSKTWRQVERYLTDRLRDLQMQAGQSGIGDADRAVLCGKVAMILEVQLALPAAMVQEARADEDTSTDTDAPAVSSRPLPIGRPEMT